MERDAGVIGASGFLGRAVVRELAGAGWRVTGFSRRPEQAEAANVAEWRSSGDLVFDGLAALVNLAGEPVDRRWTAKYRRRLRESRVGLTRRVVERLAEMPEERRPGVLVNASAVGYYGDRGDEMLDESVGRGDGFLAELCADWEEAAIAAEALGVRVVRVRIGVVFGRGGAAFERMRRVFAAGLGGRFGNGKQWMPWVHVDDLARVFALVAGDDQWRGVVNATAPGVERNADFCRKLGQALGRSAVFAVPGFGLKLLLDGFGEALLASQRAVPEALAEGGFEFRYPELEGAFGDLLGG